jgi:hypothetical protein
MSIGRYFNFARFNSKVNRWKNEESCLLGYNAVATCFMLVYFLALFFDPKDGSDMFLQNVG